MSTKNLTEGNIRKSIIILALPMLLSSMLEMLYTFIDMFWISKIGSGEVAAIGTAGFYMWLAYGISFMSVSGTGILSSQKIGEKNYEKAKEHQRSGLQLSFFLAIIYGLILFLFSENLIGFFNIDDVQVNKDASNYLKIMSLSIIFLYLNATFSSIFNSKGRSEIPFKFNIIGFVINIILDPLLIFGFWFFPELGVIGAGIATLLGRIIQFVVYVIYIVKTEDIIDKNLFIKVDFLIIREIINLGFMPAVLNFTFCFISMYITRIVSNFGSEAVAVQKVGSQIEALSWNTSTSLSVAISSFIGQNFGAKDYDRVKEGYKETLKISLLLGIFTTSIFIFIPQYLMYPFFSNEPELVLFGVDYLRILALSQIFACVEIMTSGAFNGLGKTKYPAIVSITFNLFRIPASLFLIKYLGVNGIWLAIGVSSILKGTLLYIWYKYEEKKL